MSSKRVHHWYFYLLIIFLGLLLTVGTFLLFLTVTEYRPAPVEAAASGGAENPCIFSGNELKVLSFNTGYASLGQDADFILDGGKGSGISDFKTIDKNIGAIKDILLQNPADIYMLQEIDKNSQRTGHVNQLDKYYAALPEYEWYYAPNYVCRFVPFPLQAPIGSIDSGIATFSRFKVSDASRISLPCPFSWPICTANLKRCMLVSRLPIDGENKEIIIINFHLEAYDSGEGKQAQTDQLLNLLQEEYRKGNYVIAGGDFNQIFPNVKTVVKPSSKWVPGDLEPLPQGWDGWRYVYDDSTPTCRLLNQPYQPDDPLTQHYVIDGFLVSPNLDVIEIQTLNKGFQHSDHNPVLINVRPNSQAGSTSN